MLLLPFSMSWILPDKGILEHWYTILNYQTKKTFTTHAIIKKQMPLCVFHRLCKIRVKSDQTLKRNFIGNRTVDLKSMYKALPIVLSNSYPRQSLLLKTDNCSINKLIFIGVFLAQLLLNND